MTPEKAVSQADSPRKRSRGRPTCDCAHGADALLLNARRIFAQRGFYASSVRQIAEASGVDAALISHHFGSKEALWIAVVDQIATLTQSLIEQTHLLRQSEMAPRHGRSEAHGARLRDGAHPAVTRIVGRAGVAIPAIPVV